jgi:hypothetical protein
MRRMIVLVGVVLVWSGVAAAQPSATEPAPYAPPPYVYQPAPQPALTPDEAKLLQIGEISDNTQLTGGLVAVFVGFGVGQAVERRWGETGWIFTLGETVSTAVLVWGVTQAFTQCFTPADLCRPSGNGETAMLAGAIALTGLRIWEIADAFTGPRRHNERVRALRVRLGMPPPALIMGRLAPYVAPVAGGGEVAGLSLRF